MFTVFIVVIYMPTGKYPPHPPPPHPLTHTNDPARPLVCPLPLFALIFDDQHLIYDYLCSGHMSGITD